MNKKGFTLVELLAVIVLIAVVSLIGYAGVSVIKDKMNKTAFEEKLELVISNAERYGQDNKSLIESGTLKKIKIGDLIKNNYISTDEKDSKGNKSINYYKDDSSLNDVWIRLSFSNNRIHACIVQTNTLSKKDYSNTDLFC